METNELSIIIDKPINEVFCFTIAPDNTPKWVDRIIREEVDDKPIKIGTIYRNTNDGINWNTYKVIEFEDNKLFTLKSQNSSYGVRYTYKSLGDNKTQLIYSEWDDNGLSNSDPFEQAVLEELKKVIESNGFYPKQV